MRTRTYVLLLILIHLLAACVGAAIGHAIALTREARAAEARPQKSPGGSGRGWEGTRVGVRPPYSTAAAGATGPPPHG